jgi:hypothetical protein
MLIPSGQIRLEYLNNIPYLTHQDYGWMTSGEPTTKLQSLIRESDRKMRDSWEFVVPNESFISVDDVPVYDVSVASNWNASGDYPTSHGIGYNDDLQLSTIVNAEREYTNYESVDLYLDTSGVASTPPDEAFNSYLPEMHPGYFYHDEDKFYTYPNKVTKVIRTASGDSVYDISAGSVYNLDVEDLDPAHPVYGVVLHEDFDTIVSGLPSYKQPTDGVVYAETELAPPIPEVTVASGAIQPYTSHIRTTNVSGLVTVPTRNYSHLISTSNEETAVPHDDTYINLRQSFIHIEDPVDGVFVLTYNKKGHDKVTAHDIDVSPITWDADERALSIISGVSVPYWVKQYMPTDRINNFDSTIPVILNVRDTNGVPVSGYPMTVTPNYVLTDTDGSTINGYVSGVTISGEPLLRISGLPANKHINLNNRAIGFSVPGSNTILSHEPVTIPGTILYTNDYGSAYFDVSVSGHSEPVSLVDYEFDIAGTDIPVSGDTTLTVHLETNEIVASGLANASGEYITDGTVPKLSPTVVGKDIINENIKVSGWIYGMSAKMYTRDAWLDTQSPYEIVESFPSGNVSVINSTHVSGSYVFAYDEVLATCL